jgi:hypothetical protein
VTLLLCHERQIANVTVVTRKRVLINYLKYCYDNKSNAKGNANLITNEQLVGTFKAAKVSITNWDVPSVCNKVYQKVLLGTS